MEPFLSLFIMYQKIFFFFIKKSPGALCESLSLSPHTWVRLTHCLRLQKPAGFLHCHEDKVKLFCYLQKLRFF